jgi:competence protein ComEC
LSLAGATMGLFFQQTATLMMQAAHLLLEWLWLLLDAASNNAYAVIHPASQPWWIYILVSVGVLLLLFRSGVIYRLVGVLLLLPLFMTATNALKHAEYLVDFLDVGQGLAVVVRTSNHVLLYDTGFANDGGFDIGQRVIAPYLWHQGIARLDRVILSHDDQDHTGGYRFLADEFAIDHLNVMPGSRYRSDSEQVSTCHAGDSWQWDGIRFRFLHPGSTAYGKENDRSCVLHISGPGGSVLLTGDIEQHAEIDLVDRFRDRLAADILLAPHHGSGTSSSVEFIAQVKPGEVIYSAGFRNRFGFPRPEITRRYDNHGVLQHSTATTGMVRFYFQARPGGYQRKLYRQQRQNIWQQVSEH